MIVCSGVLSVAAASLAAAAMPTPLPTPWPSGPAELGVARGLGVLGTEVLDLLHGQVVARHVQPRVQEHRTMTSGQHEAVTVDPRGVVGVVRHLLAEEDSTNLSAAKGQAHVARRGLLDRIHGKATRLVSRLRQ